MPSSVDPAPAVDSPTLPPVAPGLFSVKLTINGQSYTQPLAVKPDPRER